jgi:RND family efflux transporter MFP subunit
MKRLRNLGARRWLRVAAAAAALLCLTLFAGCSGTSSQPKQEGPPQGQGKGPGPGGPGPGQGRRPVTVRTATPKQITIERQVDISGTLVSPDQAKVSSEVAGVVREVMVELGQEVKPGHVLVRLDPQEIQLALQRAESLLRQTEAQLGIDGVKVKQPPPDEEIATVRLAFANREDARQQLQRSQRLKAQGLVTQADLDTAQTRLKVSEANYQAALEQVHSLKASLQDRRAALELAQKKLNDTTIKAPVGGRISERVVQPGEFIRENTPVVTIVQMQPLKLKTAVQEKHAGLIQPGQIAQFRVEAFPDDPNVGKVAFVSPAVDQATRTFTVEVLVDNANRKLKPGFFAKGVIVVKKDENVVAVPEETISTLAGVSSVFVIEQKKVRQQVVTPGLRKDKLVEVTGLNGNELLAASNLSQLATGVFVEIDRGAKEQP